MSTKEIKQKLHTLIDNGDDDSVKGFYHIIKEYLNSFENFKMILESEIDVIPNINLI